MKKDLIEYLDEGDIYFGIEGYSYGSTGNNLIDLVTLGTLMRNMLMNDLNAVMSVYAPSTVKKSTCHLVYDYKYSSVKDIKNCISRTPLYLAGASMVKHNMFTCIKDYGSNDSLYEFVKDNYEDIYSLKKIPSPIDDIIDAYWIINILMSEKMLNK